jgi:hypothetical protein
MTRNQKFALYLALAIVGSIGIGLSVIPIVGPHRGTLPDMMHIVAGTLAVTVAMMWACYFAVRAHLSQDEFNRQREIASGYWGGWLGIAASAPVFVFMAIGSLGKHTPPIIMFTLGYVLAPVFGAVGTIGARLWLRQRDRQTAQ